MGPTRYLILQQIPISSLLDPNPVIETTENSESNMEINLLPRDVRYEILHHFNLRDDEITPRDGYSRKITTMLKSILALVFTMILCWILISLGQVVTAKE